MPDPEMHPTYSPGIILAAVPLAGPLAWEKLVLDYETFNELVGSQVAAVSEQHGSVMLEVVEAERAAGERPDNAFSVLFKGPSEPFLEQMTHEIDLGASGSHPIFLVPINQHSDGFEYEAVFTALAES